MPQYNAYIDHECSTFYNTCISFARALSALHRIATVFREYSNSDNLNFPDNMYPIAVY
jgi:hypothetical protein